MTKNNSKRVWIFRATRGIGIIAVIAFLIWQRGRIIAAGEILIQGNLWAWFIAACLQFASLYFATLRLSYLLQSIEKNISFTTMYTDLVCTVALNTALLMGVGDIYRIRRTNQYISNLALTSAVILLDRILGFAVVCTLALFAMLLVGSQGFALHNTVLLLGALGLIGLAIALWGLSKRKNSALLNDIKRPFIAIAAHPTLALKATLCSFTLSGIWLTSIVVIAGGLGLQADIAPIAFAAATVAVAAILPISIGGIGVREAGYALLLASHGVSTSQAIALGVAQYALLLPIVLSGGIAGFVRWRRETNQ